MIRCKCGGETGINNSRPSANNTTRRRHTCRVCNFSFFTIESVEKVDMLSEIEELKQKLAQIQQIVNSKD